jgi:hypothetical protein
LVVDLLGLYECFRRGNRVGGGPDIRVGDGFFWQHDRRSFSRKRAALTY